MFLAIMAQVAWSQTLDGSISLKFFLETRLKSESFEPLIDFLAFLVKKGKTANFCKITNFMFFWP